MLIPPASFYNIEEKSLVVVSKCVRSVALMKQGILDRILHRGGMLAISRQ